jgi:Serine/threonine protein kinase
MFSIQESELLSRLDHPNIVKFLAMHHTESFLILEMELLKGGSLAYLLSSRTLTELEAASIMKQIFQGVCYLHKVQVLHRDLKPENIMFQDVDLCNVKITDFGLSTEYNLEERLQSRSGTMAYMAPEQVLQKQYSEPVDI